MHGMYNKEKNISFKSRSRQKKKTNWEFFQKTFAFLYFNGGIF